MNPTTNQRYVCTFTHHRDGGTVAAMFTNDQRSRAEAHAKHESTEHPSATVEVVAICERGQNIIATWTNGRRNGTPRWIAYAPAAALALFLTITQIPAGCAITGHTSEGFPVATCENGTTIYRDMDGAGGYNSGLPYVVPGIWVTFK